MVRGERPWACKDGKNSYGVHSPIYSLSYSSQAHGLAFPEHVYFVLLNENDLNRGSVN